MNDLRKAAEMALEALEDIFGKEKKDVGAINALRQALDKPDIEPQALVQMAVLAERGACAKVCLEGTDMPVQADALKIIRAERERISNAIRARGEK